MTVLNAMAVSEVSACVSAREMEMTVDSSTFVVRAGVTLSSGSNVMLPASSTDLTSVKSSPSTKRDLPLIFTVT